MKTLQPRLSIRNTLLGYLIVLWLDVLLQHVSKEREAHLVAWSISLMSSGASQNSPRVLTCGKDHHIHVNILLLLLEENSCLGEVGNILANQNVSRLHRDSARLSLHLSHNQSKFRP